MAFLYWIHHKDHTDIFTQGYVGVTKDTVFKRYLKHQSDSRKENPIYPVHRAMKKYGEDVQVSTICCANMEYVLALEEKLRPLPQMAWNINRGGVAPLASIKLSEERRLLIKNGCVGRKTAPRQRKSTEKAIKTFTEKHPLDFTNINLEVWRMCSYFYERFLLGESRFVAGRRVGVSKGSLACMWKKFNQGFNPKVDTRMISFTREYPLEIIPDFSDVVSNTNFLGVHEAKNQSYCGYRTVGKKRHSKYFKFGSVLSKEDALQLAIDYRNYLLTFSDEEFLLKFINNK